MSVIGFTKLESVCYDSGAIAEQSRLDFMKMSAPNLRRIIHQPKTIRSTFLRKC